MTVWKMIAPAVLIAGLMSGPTAFAGPLDDANAGLDAMKQGDYNHAATLFTSAIKSGQLTGDDLEFAYSERGQAYLKSGNTKAAIADFKQALKLKPDDQDAQDGLAQAQAGGAPAPESANGSGGGSGRGGKLAQAGMDAFNGGNYAQAAQLFTQALNSGGLSGDDRELALLYRGKAYAQNGNARGALADFGMALHMKPDDQEAEAGLAQALTSLHAATPGTPIDAATCAANFSTKGKFLTGKSFTSFAEYPTLSPLEAMAGLYIALPKYTPYPGIAWQIQTVDVTAGTLTATISSPNTQLAISLTGQVEPDKGGSKITITEAVPPLMPTLDLKGSLCSTLAAAAAG